MYIQRGTSTRNVYTFARRTEIRIKEPLSIFQFQIIETKYKYFNTLSKHSWDAKSFFLVFVLIWHFNSISSHFNSISSS